MKNNKHTLKRYLLLVLAGFALLMTLCFGVAVTQVYDWGLDDSAEFYLLNDLQDYRNGVSLKHSTYRHSYIGLDSVPEDYRYLFGGLAHGKRESQTLLYHEGAKQFSYLLPAAFDESQPISKDNLLVMIHSFPYEADEPVVGISLSELITGLFVVAGGLMVLFSSLIYRSITMPVTTLQVWAKDATKTKHVSDHYLDVDALRFTELTSVGEQLNEAIQHIVAITEREKSFVSSLSHELRTPMAIVSAALDLLERRDFEDRGFDERDQSKLEKIRRANQRMTETADTLLRLWQGKLPHETQVNVELRAEVETIIKDSQVFLGSAASEGSTEVDNQIDSALIINAPYQSLLIVLSNLIKNALQYAGSGQVCISAAGLKVTVSNTVTTHRKAQPAKDSSYGFGLGLFIAEQVAQQQGWCLKTEQKGDNFVAEIELTASSQAGQASSEIDG